MRNDDGFPDGGVAPSGWGRATLEFTFLHAKVWDGKIINLRTVELETREDSARRLCRVNDTVICMLYASCGFAYVSYNDDFLGAHKIQAVDAPVMKYRRFTSTFFANANNGATFACASAHGHGRR